MSDLLIRRRAMLEVTRQPTMRIFPRERQSGLPSTDPSATLATLKTFGVLWYTWDETDPTNFDPRQDGTHRLQASPVIRGYNWALIQAALATAGVVFGTSNVAGTTGYLYSSGGTDYVQFRGTGIFKLSILFDALALGHSPPLSHLQEFRAVNPLCKLGNFLFNFESINQCWEWNPVLRPMQQVSRQYILTAKASSGCNKGGYNGWNAYGCNAIDKYEHSNTGDFVSGFNTCSAVYHADLVSCPHDPAHNSLPDHAHDSDHCWECDITSNAYIQAMTTAAGGAKSGYMEEISPSDPGYLPGQLYRNAWDFEVWDNMGEDPYYGSALNRFPDSYDSTAYRGQRNAAINLRTGWKGFMQQLQSDYAAYSDFYIWANAPYRFTAYDVVDCKNRFCEHFFLNPGWPQTLASLDTIKARILDCVSNGARFWLNAEPGTAAVWNLTAGPGGANGTWSDIADYVRAQGGIENVYATMMRSYICWQEGFKAL